jgi:menaquinone-specific isochorismate synthase
MSAGAEPVVTLRASTRFTDRGSDPLQAFPLDGFAWWHADWGFSTAGAAATVDLDSVPAALAMVSVDDEVRAPGTGAIAVGALSFTVEPGDQLVIPARVSGRTADGRTWVTTIGPAPGLVSASPRAASTFTVTEVQGRERWRTMVRRALDEIDGAAIEKVVLAREVTIDADAPFDRAQVVQRLRARELGCFVFATPQGFVGASPELLVRRRGSSVVSRPMAGTVPVADEAGLAHLGSSEKLDHEHAVVVDAIRATMARHSTTAPAVTGPRPVPVGDLAHLVTELRAELVEPTPTALELARMLHPTPAVGGTPTAAALALIDELEPAGRGQYAGAVGWVDAAGDGEFAVALRSASLVGSRARLYAGAGIVRGSDPDEEWEETEAKLAPMLRALMPSEAECLDKPQGPVSIARARG